MLRASSKKTPMFLATVDSGTAVSLSFLCGIESLIFICGAHIRIISVFVALNFSLFNSATQSWMRMTTWIVSSTERETQLGMISIQVKVYPVSTCDITEWSSVANKH